MGQAQSGDRGRNVNTEELSHELALKFTRKCFSPLEIYSFRDVFHSLADHQDGVAYLKEDTLARFLEIPDILGASSIVFHMASYLGAFPFGHEAPAVLGFEQMIMVVVIMTERYQKVLRNAHKDRVTLLFRSLAVIDRKLSLDEKIARDTGTKEVVDGKEASQASKSRASVSLGFDIDRAANDDEDYTDDDDDDLTLAALESLDAISIFKHGDAMSTSQANIPSDNLRKLIMLLLLVAPLEAQQSLSEYSDRLVGAKLDGLRKTASNVLAAFVDLETVPGVKPHRFDVVVSASLPLLFKGLNPLFEHFLFSKNIDFTKRRDEPEPVEHPIDSHEPRKPLLEDEGEILDLNVLSQLSFFIPRPIFGRVRMLYSGGEAGFSMGSFETRVLNWRAPTILLVSGSRISDPPVGGQERAFADTLAPKRFPDSSKSSYVVYGVYLSQPWKQTHKECIGEPDTLLFQLEPVHEVFHASTINKDYVSFTKPPNAHAGVAIGCPQPKAKNTAGLSSLLSVGAVSLSLDSSFEFGVFTHNHTSGGGAFHGSQTRKFDWQDRFEIESLEVWGIGGDDEADKQRERWAWEEREAEARRKINLGTGDVEADRALLEMAGIMGGNRSGGSMN